MHPLLALSTFSALLSTAQALVVHPLPRAVTHTTTSHHDCTGPTPLAPFETDAAGRTIRTVTFACATLNTAINPTPTGPVDHGSSALHSSDAEDHHGAVKRDSGGESSSGDSGNGVGEPDATPTRRKRCFWYCPDGGLKPAPSATPTASKRGILDGIKKPLDRRDLSAANQGPGVKERDNLARDVDNQDQETEEEAARQLPRSPKKPKETEEERKAREAKEAEAYGGSIIARSLSPPTKNLGHHSARDVDGQDQKEDHPGLSGDLGKEWDI